jgi:hypothetical protein
MVYSEPTRLRLATLSGNECAFPGCIAPIFDTEHGVMVGEVCHIKGRRPGSARYDPTQTDDERDAFENLILMCSPHHDIIDKPATRDAFTVEMLQGYKRDHETRFKNTVVKEDVLGQFVRLLSQLQPVKPAASLEPVVEWLMTHPDNQMGLDYYDFRVALRNTGEKTARDFLLDVEIPSRYMQDGSSIHGEVPSRRQGYRLFRRTIEESMPPHVIYPGDTKPVTQLGYIVKKQHYLQGIAEAIKVRVYSGDELVSTTEYPIGEMLNAERVAMILAARVEAIKKIHDAARAFLGDEGDLTDVTIFLADGPITGKRAVRMDNAYNMMKALAKAGWLVIDNEDAMTVKLTDEGIRIAS